MKKLLTATQIAALATAALLGFATCDNHKGKQLSDYPSATTEDSMVYYLGQVRAHDYWENANNDTSLRSERERQQYLDGIKAGMDMMKRGEENRAYNQGVRVGVRIAYNLNAFERNYGIDLDRKILYAGIEQGLMDTHNKPANSCQKEFFRLMDGLKKEARERDRQRSQQTLIEEAREHNMSKLADNLYYRILRKGTGPYAHTGDAIFIASTYRLANGEDMGIPTPEMATIGAAGIPEILNKAYTRLNKGSVIEFATTAESIFASRSEIMGLKPTEVITVTVTMNDIISNLDDLDESGIIRGDSLIED